MLETDIAELRGFTVGSPDLGVSWFCPISGCALNDSGPAQAWLNSVLSI